MESETSPKVDHLAYSRKGGFSASSISLWVGVAQNAVFRQEEWDY